jgi:hypothetical protein
VSPAGSSGRPSSSGRRLAASPAARGIPRTGLATSTLGLLGEQRKAHHPD